MFPPLSTPWNPATTAILPLSRAALMARAPMSWMRARANALSVRMRTWCPSSDTALPPSAWMASASSPTVTLTLRREAASRDVADALDIAHGSTAVFLHDEQGAGTLQWRPGVVKSRVEFELLM